MVEGHAEVLLVELFDELGPLCRVLFGLEFEESVLELDQGSFGSLFPEEGLELCFHVLGEVESVSVDLVYQPHVDVSLRVLDQSREELFLVLFQDVSFEQADLFV